MCFWLSFPIRILFRNSNRFEGMQAGVLTPLHRSMLASMVLDSVSSSSTLLCHIIMVIVKIFLFRGFNQARFNGIPVDNVPDSLDVTGPDVSVINVVGVLPDVDSQKGLESSGGL